MCRIFRTRITSCTGGAAGGISSVCEDLWNKRSQLPPTVFREVLRLRTEWGSAQAWLAHTRGDREEQPETGGQPTMPAVEGANQVPQPITPVELQGLHLDGSMDDTRNLDPSSQCNHLSPPQEADLVHHRTSTVAEQTKVYHKIVMEGMENTEGWLDCVMLDGSSWSQRESFS